MRPDTTQIERWLWLALCAAVLALLAAGGSGPLWLTFPAAALTALFLPGYLLVSLVPALRDPLESRLERAAMAMLLSVVVQTLSCVVTLEIGLRLRWVALAQVLLMGGVLIWTIRRRRDLALASGGPLDAASWFTLAGVAALAALAAAAYAGGGFIEREQTILARKIAENPEAHKFSIMYLPGQAHTYLYEPLGFVIAWTANATGADVIVVTDKFWAVDILMTGIFGAAFVAAAVRWRFGGAVWLAFVALYALKYPVADLGNAGLLMPFPNRYGFGPGVLVPAGAWLIVRAEEARRPWALVALIPAFALCLTVFHAREALLLLLVFAMFATAVVVVGPDRRRALARYGTALAACALLLGAFSIHHRRNVSHVQAVTHDLKTALRGELRAMLRGDVSATDPAYFKTFPIFVGEYEFGGFYKTLAGTTRPAAAFPTYLTAVLLPVALVLTRRRWVWFGVAVFTGLLLFSHVPILFTLLSSIVGTTDLFHCPTLFFGLTLLLFVCALIEVGVALSGGVEWATRRWVWASPGRVTAALFVFANTAAFLVFRRFDRIAVEVQHSPSLLLWAHLALLAVAAMWASRRRGLPVEPGPSAAWGCAAVFALSVPAVWNHLATAPTFDRHIAANIESGYPIADVYDDYDRLVRRPNMLSPFPRELTRHLRERVAPLSVFLAPNDVATTVPLYANVYVAHAGHNLSTDAAYYRDWHARHGAHLVFNDLAVAAMWKDNLRFLDAYAVDYLLVTPAHRDKLRPYFDAVNGAAPVFTSEFTEAGFEVVRVDRSAIPRAVELLQSKVDAGEIRF